MPNILSLPNEVLNLVFGADLGVFDMLACAAVCRQLCDLICNDIFLQYKSDLRASGMIDGPPGRTAVAERLDALRLHGRLLATSALDCHTFPKSIFARATQQSAASSYWTLSSDGSVVHFARSADGTTCAVIELPSRVRGLNASHWAVPTPVERKVDVLAVDLSQGLMVMIDNRNDRDVLIHFLATGSEECRPHPLATRPIVNISMCTTTASSEAYYYVQSVQVFGATVSWVIPLFEYGIHCLQCWNWHTGKLVWQRTFPTSPLYCQLDENLILVTKGDGAEDILSIYDLHESDQGGPLCNLGMPRVRCGQTHAIHLQSHVPALRQDALVPFTRDPSSTAVLLHLAIGSDAEGSTNILILIIPLSTLHAQTPNTGTLPGHTQDLSRRRDELSKTDVVDWDEWGPDGTLLLNHPERLTSPWSMPNVFAGAFGSRYSVLVCDVDENAAAGTRKGSVFTFDVDPWAAKNARRYRDLRPEHRDGAQTGDGQASNDKAHAAQGQLDKLTALPANVDSRPTTLPYAVRCMELTLPEGRRPTQVLTTHDGFALAYEDQDADVELEAFTV